MRCGDLKETKRLAGKLLEFCHTVDFGLPEELQELCSELENRCAETAFHVVVVGMFSRGKSAFLNALIGRRLLYESEVEATGAVTFLRNSPGNSVEVRTPKGIERFALDEHSYDRLRERVDRKNSMAADTQVFVDCPLKSFDEDICFMDTPGLNGINANLAQVTREAMNQADAVIFLVLPKSLEAEELKLLRGENPYIGKLRTKNILFVMTKIGPVLKDVPLEQEEAKLDLSRNEIKRQFAQNGLEHVSRDMTIHAIDSVDFLQTVDDTVYDSMLHPEGSPSREELRRRSRFDAFRQALARQLACGNRALQLQEDLADLMLEICGILQKTLRARRAEQKQNSDASREMLENQLKQYELVRTRSRNRILKYIREQIETLNDSAGQDSAARQAVIQREMDTYIFRSFNRENDFDDRKYRLLTEHLRQQMDDLLAGMTKNVNAFYGNLSKQLSLFTEKTFRETFGLSPDAAYSIEAISLEKRQVQDVQLSDGEKELEQEVRDAEAQMSALRARSRQLVRSKAEQEEQYERRKRAAEETHRREVQRLGDRPPPETKYETKYREVTVFLWFTKPEPYKDPYLDYTRVEEYDRKYAEAQGRYEQKRRELRKATGQIDELERQLAGVEREMRQTQCELDIKRKELDTACRYQQEQWRRQKDKMLARQKEKLTVLCRNRLEAAIRQVNNAVIIKNDETKERLVQTTDKLLDEAMKRYRTQLQKSIDGQSHTSCRALDDLIKTAEEFEQKIREEGPKG